MLRKCHSVGLFPLRDDRVSMATVVLIKDMMEVDSKKRISARRALDTAHSILSRV